MLLLEGVRGQVVQAAVGPTGVGIDGANDWRDLHEARTRSSNQINCLEPRSTFNLLPKWRKLESVESVDPSCPWNCFAGVIHDFFNFSCPELAEFFPGGDHFDP